jgi:hypothetical protein
VIADFLHGLVSDVEPEHGKQGYQWQGADQGAQSIAVTGDFRDQHNQRGSNEVFEVEGHPDFPLVWLLLKYPVILAISLFNIIYIMRSDI